MGVVGPCPPCLGRTWAQHPSLPTKAEWAKGTCSKSPPTCHPKGSGWKSGLWKSRLPAQLASVSGVCSEAGWSQGVQAISIISVPQLLYFLLGTSLDTQGQWSENQGKLCHRTREKKQEVKKKDTRCFIELHRWDWHVQRLTAEKICTKYLFCKGYPRLRSITSCNSFVFVFYLPWGAGIAIPWPHDL